jgi:hypothetical protein
MASWDALVLETAVACLLPVATGVATVLTAFVAGVGVVVTNCEGVGAGVASDKS